MYIEIVYTGPAGERTTHVKPSAVLEVLPAEVEPGLAPCSEIVTDVSALTVKGEWADVLRAVHRAQKGGEARFEGVNPPEHLAAGWQPLGS